VLFRDISVSGSGVVIIGSRRFDGVQFESSGAKRSRFDGNKETVLSADLRGAILNPEVIDFASQAKTMDMECRLIRSDGRLVAIEFLPFPRFHVMRAGESDAWSDAILGS
jgi:hypothetical protein